jgi:hypothetical protein
VNKKQDGFADMLFKVMRLPRVTFPDELKDGASSLMTVGQENELYYSLVLQDAIAELCQEKILDVEA